MFVVTDAMRAFLDAQGDQPSWDSEFRTSQHGAEEERVRGTKATYVRVWDGDGADTGWKELVIPFDGGE